MSALGKFRQLAQELEELRESDVDGLLDRLREQHERLRFDTIDIETTWDLGSLIREIGVAADLPIAIDVSLGLQTVFHAALPGSSADNDAWARRKAAVADRYLESSLAVGLVFDRDHDGFDTTSRLPLESYAAHGGALPLLLSTGVAVGHAVVSGLPAVHDHALVATAIGEILVRRDMA